ncbi:hypothetical protein THRCLA_21833 [Thraustotheca clavata]|uniref:Uncharacterized protein n=1 Tax=Thraustotheca clavata TaxID=74557 RepID=A0A1V9ZNB7_9STRA|nr:hypothetical protein THRCLA_21833 [Thraustotheca clavata]
MDEKKTMTECQYSYKPCKNPRTTKRNGTLHLLCEYHRKKANAIQRVYAQKKRQQKLAEKTPQERQQATLSTQELYKPVLPSLQYSSNVENFGYLTTLLRDSRLIQGDNIPRMHGNY